MEIKRTTEVEIETYRQFVVRKLSGSAAIFCPECAEPMLAAEQIAAMFGISRRTVYQFVETGEIHFAEIETGAVMICLPSLAAILETEEKLLNNAETNELNLIDKR